MRILVTGAAGFIGSHVADRLLSEGHAVTGLDNFDPYYDPAKKRRNILPAQSHPSYTFQTGDICDAPGLERLFDETRPELVVHLAASAGVRASIERPHKYVAVNEQGALNILEACRQRGNVPIVLASTSSVYGKSARIPFVEDDPADKPLSPYAASKRSAELMVHAYHEIYRLPVAVLRFFTVYGPRGRPDMAVWLFTQALLSGHVIKLHGEETARDFTYIDDIVSGVLGAVTWVQGSGALGTFNLGRSEPVRVRRLIELLSVEFAVEVRIELGELMPGESLVTAANVERARTTLGYEPRVSLEEGVRLWAEWYRRFESAS